MADEKFPKQVIYSTATTAAPIVPANQPTANPSSMPNIARPHRSEFNLFVSWIAGMFLILACGWGFIGMCVLIERALGLRMSIELFGVFTCGMSLVMFVLLEKNLWLSRFMGLRTGPYSTQLSEALFFWLTGLVGLLLRSSEADNPAATKAQPVKAEGFREIAETVVFVIVLVVLLRTFLVEAFVIPTGSMADTLLGHHKALTCQQCGYSYIVNCSSEVDPPPGRDSERVLGAFCPLCRYPNYLVPHPHGGLP